jgi:hypothetical protein
MARSADPGRFGLARFYFEAVAPAIRRLEGMEPRDDPDGTGPAPPSPDALESATAELIEAASVACLGGEVGTFPADEVAAMLEAHRATFEAISRRLHLAPLRMPRDPRAELLLHGLAAEAAYLRTVPGSSDPALARAVFPSAWLAMRSLRRDGPVKRLTEALRDPGEAAWARATDAAVAAIEPFLLADTLESIDASAIDALWPFDATIVTAAYLERLRSWVRDLVGFRSDDPGDWDETELAERPYLVLAIARSVAQAHAWRLDVTTPPVSTRWDQAVRLTSQAIDILAPRLLDLASIDAGPDDLPWPDGFAAAAKRAESAWTFLGSRVLVPDRVA